MRRETSRVSFLMCPFCVRHLLTGSATPFSPSALVEAGAVEVSATGDRVEPENGGRKAMAECFALLRKMLVGHWRKRNVSSSLASAR